LGAKHEYGIFSAKLDIIKPIRSNSGSYKFINSLLAYILPSADQQKELKNLQSKISKEIANKKNSGDLSDASVFFYDLNKGRWVGVDENKKFIPSSMMKVIIMVSYLKKSEKNPDILDKELAYDEKIDQLVKSDPLNMISGLKPGKKYKAGELIEKMIIDSDNGAQFLLIDNISQTDLDAIYNALNIENPDTENNFLISPRIYSLFLRILYSATYLNQENSEKALNMLSKTTFKEGLAGGIPENIAIAHKYGENFESDTRQAELHDCGIIYTENPYLLCIMTKGKTLDGLKATIREISSIVYREHF